MACSITGETKTAPLLLQRPSSLVVVERGQELIHIKVVGKAIHELLPLLEIKNNRTKIKLTQQNVRIHKIHVLAKNIKLQLNRGQLKIQRKLKISIKLFLNRTDFACLQSFQNLLNFSHISVL